MTILEVLRTGPLCLVEDLGRPGRAGEGITVSGALDRRSFMQGNRLLGNDIGAPGLEVLLGDLSVRPDRDVLVAVTGAWCPLTVDGEVVPFGTPVPVHRDAVLALGRPERGLRSYLTVRGGLIPAGEFGGSWSRDTSSGIGPDPVRVGDRLPVGTQRGGTPMDATVLPAIHPPGDVSLRLTPGPRPDLLDAADRSLLATTAGVISSDSDRVGLRINGFQLRTTSSDASEALPLGAVQAPPGGELIVFLADHPTTGGYPVIGVVDLQDLDVLAQCPPGQRLRFNLRPTPRSPRREDNKPAGQTRNTGPESAHD